MRIALVEPSKTVRRIVTEMITADHEVWSAADAPEALAILRRDPSIRALITSAELPSLSGVALTVQARALAGSHRPLYILLMSSNDQRAKRIEALDNGADDFISKPPAAEELRARLRTAERITTMQAELVRLATTDTLTGLLTRRAFFARADELAKQAGAGRPFSVLVCDLDKFKSINDTYGHDAGDAVLREVGAEANRIGCPVGRLGGEELAFLLAKPVHEAIAIAEQFRAAVADLPICCGPLTLTATCSIGVAQWKSGDTVDTFLRRADLAMYEAKRTGRDRVVASNDVTVSNAPEGWRGAVRAMARQD